MSTEWYLISYFDQKHYFKLCFFTRKCLKREKDGNNIRNLESKIVSEHPLKVTQITVLESKGTKLSKLGSSYASSASSTLSLDQHCPLSLDGLDPLSILAKQEIDPLSKIANEMESKPIPVIKKSIVKRQSSSNVLDEDEEKGNEKLVSWNNRKSIILNKYTTTEKLTISSSFLIHRDSVKVQGDQMKHYLEQLDKFDEEDVLSLPGLSQQEYVTKIQQLNFNLIDSWKSDQRVKALKIAIQCAKLLSDTSPLPFYPSKFVLVTDILDIFGKLVYDRLKSKSAAE